MGPIGLPEMMVIFVLALILFGPKKLPELGRTLGKALSEFRRAKNELQNTLQTHLHELERETQLEKPSLTSTPDYSSTRYSYPYEDYKYDASDPAPSYENDSSPSTPQIEAHQEEPPLPNPSVVDTVPRNNGVQPLEPVAVAPQEQDPV